MKNFPKGTVERIDKFNAVFEEMGSKLVSRRDEIRAIQLALLLRQNVLFFGKPGTAKSLMASMTMQAVTGTSNFQAQLRKEMTGDSVFGPLNIKKYQTEGVLEYNTAGMLPEASLVYLDEFFDANDNLMRGLLECLNERLFTCGRTRRHIPMHTCIATTNFYKPDDKREAVVDRFLIRVQVEPVNLPDNQVRMFQQYLGGGFDMENKISYADLEYLCEEVHRVEIPRLYMEELADMITHHTAQRSNVRSVSDRRACWSLDLLRANALLRKSGEVGIKDFPVLQYAFGVVHSANEERPFFAALETVSASHELRLKGQADLRKALEITDIGEHVVDNIAKYDNDQLTEVINKGNLLGELIGNPLRSRYDERTEEQLNECAQKMHIVVAALTKEMESREPGITRMATTFDPVSDFQASIPPEVNAL